MFILISRSNVHFVNEHTKPALKNDDIPNVCTSKVSNTQIECNKKDDVDTVVELAIAYGFGITSEAHVWQDIDESKFLIYT